MSAIDHDHVLYGPWDMERSRHFLSFWIIFCPLTSFLPGKLKSWKNDKNAWRYDHFTHCMLYCSWDMTRDWCSFFFFLGYFLSFYTLHSPKNQNRLKKNKKTPGDIIFLHICTKNYDHLIYSSWVWRTDGQRDEWTEKATQEAGAPPKNPGPTLVQLKLNEQSLFCDIKKINNKIPAAASHLFSLFLYRTKSYIMRIQSKNFCLPFISMTAATWWTK